MTLDAANAVLAGAKSTFDIAQDALNLASAAFSAAQEVLDSSRYAILYSYMYTSIDDGYVVDM